MKYSEKLKDPRWQKKRLEVLSRDNWVCQKCFDDESMLAVHHCRYIAGKEPWEYELSNFITLCESCHENEYETRKDYEHDLLEILKDKRFLADDIHSITSGLLSLEIINSPEYTSTLIEYVFRSPHIMAMLDESYREHLRKLSEARQAKENEVV